jgi:hypothetical protein
MVTLSAFPPRDIWASPVTGEPPPGCIYAEGTGRPRACHTLAGFGDPTVLFIASLSAITSAAELGVSARPVLMAVNVAAAFLTSVLECPDA